MKMIRSAARWLALLGPHELVALALFLCTLAVWAETLSALYARR